MRANVPRPGRATRKNPAVRETDTPATLMQASGTLSAENIAVKRKPSRMASGKRGKKQATVEPDDTNPQGSLGFRNLDCPQYLRCLDRAVRQSWPTFSCQYCFKQTMKEPRHAEYSDLEAPGWVDLWTQAGWEG